MSMYSPVDGASGPCRSLATRFKEHASNSVANAGQKSHRRMVNLQRIWGFPLGVVNVCTISGDVRVYMA